MPEDARDIGKLLSDRALVGAALLQGAWEALRVHRAAGQPLAIWRDGQGAWVSPDEFERGLIEAQTHRPPSEY